MPPIGAPAPACGSGTVRGACCFFTAARPSPLTPAPPAPPSKEPEGLCAGVSSPDSSSSGQPAHQGTAWVRKDLRGWKVGRSGVHCSRMLSAAVANWQQATCSRCPGGQRQTRSPPAARHGRPLSARLSWGQRRPFSSSLRAPPPTPTSKSFFQTPRLGPAGLGAGGSWGLSLYLHSFVSLCYIFQKSAALKSPLSMKEPLM